MTKYRTLDELLDDKEVEARDTVRPNLTLSAGGWDNFRFALEYENLSRSAHVYPGAVFDVMMVEFIERLKSRVIKSEGSLSGFNAFRGRWGNCCLRGSRMGLGTRWTMRASNPSANPE